MKWFYNMKLSKKLTLGFIIVAVLAGVIGIVGIFSLVATQKKSENIITNYGNSQGELGFIAEAFQKTRTVARDLIIETKDTNYKKYQDQIVANDETIVKYMAELKKRCNCQKNF
ncbi:MCP four helix bundle domain-containing protein [Clostridium estertheticum]|nr:MCP four helix bundle domain-containing protein [Clostridium estertheticum]